MFALFSAVVVTGFLAPGMSTTAGAASSNLFAVVDQSGNLISGSGVEGTTHLGVGRYEVTFTRNVGSCAYVATTAQAYGQAISVFTAGGHKSLGGVYVETKTQAGALIDGPFNLVVDCSTYGTAHAVVGYSANLVRSTGGTTLTPLGSGRYDVTFQAAVSSCAYLATVGDPGHGAVNDPVGVYTGSGPDRYTVYIETKNPGGGLQGGIPFHLVVVCPVAANVRIAVVRADGLIDRGSNLTSSYNASTGNYTIVTNRDVSGCATVATRGSVDEQVPFTPATVEVVPGPAPNTAGIQVRDLLFFGGELLNEAFHAAMTC